ncbi:MAG: penicillin-insensitive murein endopeptidase [Alphaproteobacteria bacterium]
MRRLVLALGALAVWSGAAVADDGQGWATARTPSKGPPTVIGKHALGCIGGAEALPADGPGYQALRLARRRNHGHPDTIAFVQALGRHAQAQGLGLLLIADMGQPRGGPMLKDHASHQSGLDVDVWFRRTPLPLPEAEREKPLALDMLRPDGKAVDSARFGRAEIELLRFAATRPAVDRILVNPAIKSALCARVEGDRRWLRRIRPWWGHNMHFHVRLACPPGQDMCEDGPPPPPGDGCGGDLGWWFSLEAAKALAERLARRRDEPPKPRPLPPACAAVLAAPAR